MKRHRYRLLTAGLISGLLVAGMAEVPVQAAAPDPGSPSTGSSGLQAADEVAAAKRAASTGKRVLVQAATNEFQQVFALPSGGFQLESAVVPQRVKRAPWA